MHAPYLPFKEHYWRFINISCRRWACSTLFRSDGSPYIGSVFILVVCYQIQEKLELVVMKPTNMHDYLHTFVWCVSQLPQIDFCCFVHQSFHCMIPLTVHGFISWMTIILFYFYHASPFFMGHHFSLCHVSFVTYTKVMTIPSISSN